MFKDRKSAAFTSTKTKLILLKLEKKNFFHFEPNFDKSNLSVIFVIEATQSDTKAAHTMRNVMQC